MADAATLLARLKAARPATARFVDPVTRQVRELPVDPSLAACCRPDTMWIPVLDSLAVRVSQLLTLSDEDRVAVDNLVGDMVGECAVTPVSDDVLLHVLGHLADRGFTIIPEARRG